MAWSWSGYASSRHQVRERSPTRYRLEMVPRWSSYSRELTSKVSRYPIEGSVLVIYMSRMLTFVGMLLFLNRCAPSGSKIP